MAVDFAIPLITNVKNAKLLAEALVPKLPLDVSSIDCRCSFLTHSFPDLVNVSAFLPHPTPHGTESNTYVPRAVLVDLESGTTTLSARVL
jgi:carbamoyl-phosphate synthase/aspartate carbamoyltransferase